MAAHPRLRSEGGVDEAIIRDMEESLRHPRRRFTLADIPQHIEPALAAGRIDDVHSNFYIQPTPVISFLDDHPELFVTNKLSLDRLRNLFTNIMRIRSFTTFLRSDERSRPGFIENEFRKMHKIPDIHRASRWLFPYLIEGETKLSFPTKDVFDFPIYLMLYILNTLTRFPGGRRSFTVSFRIDETPYHPILNERTHRPITIIDGRISGPDLAAIYMTIMRMFARSLPGNDTSTWNGSEESGVRILLRNVNMHRSARTHIEIRLTPTPSVNHAHGWTQEIEDLLNASPIKSAVMTVRNKEDNKCLIYCVIMGLITKLKEGGARAFGKNTLMVESSEVFCKASYLYTDDDEISVLLRKLGRLLLRPEYSDGDVNDPLYQYCLNIDEKAGTLVSVSEFRKEFAEIESKLVPPSVGIDVYGMDFNVNTHIYPLYMSRNRTKTIDLLCVTPPDARCSHYCLIVNIQRLLHDSGGKQFFSCPKCGESYYHRRKLLEHHCNVVVRNDEVPGEGGYHYSNKEAANKHAPIVGKCPKCRLCFHSEFALNYHKEHCLMSGQTGYRHVRLVTYEPEIHPMLEGQEFDVEKEEKNELRRRILYADFECSINKESGVHSFMSYGIYDWLSRQYKCGYSLSEFVKYLVDVAFNNSEDRIYVYFHNAMGYDANFILRYVMTEPEYSNWGIQVIMKSMNRLQKLVFYIRKENVTKTLHIGDTFLFLTLSLEKIVSSIRKDDINSNKENFYRFFDVFHLRYPNVRDVDIDHILRKNIFPYKFFDESSKLDTPITEFLKIFRPDKDNLQYFSDRVTERELEEQYEDTRRVMDVFECRTARDYHDLYLCCDVMQLADVFNRSMEILYESHHIYLPNYLGMPSASWGAFLRHDPTMRIPLYEDTFFAEFFKGMIRGGITSAALRHAVADEKHSIVYFDVNGLYPYVMQKYKYPCGKFELIHVNLDYPATVLRLRRYFDELESSGRGMCFCVDLEIPESLKKLTDLYPFAPEHRRIYKEYYEDPSTRTLTPFLKRWSEANNREQMKEFTGLVCTLYDKEKYNVHWRLLQFYMDHGVIVKKIHFAVAFDEGDYLAGYIRKNIEIRNGRRDELGKTIYKLLGNSIYGKTFESPFKRNTYEIVRDPIKIQGMLTEGNIAALTPIDELGWIVRFDGEEVILDKPTYIGACVCEYAKLHMYTLLYDKLKRIFPDGCDMVYTDTDSFILYVTHPDGVGSDPSDLFGYIRRKDPELLGSIGGQIKSETGEDDTIQEVIALRSKVYAYKTKKGYIGKRAKGTTHEAQDLQLDWDTYKNALDSLVSINTKNTQFVRKVFKIATQEIFRQSLSVNDGKRFICEDGIHTHAFGFY